MNNSPEVEIDYSRTGRERLRSILQSLPEANQRLFRRLTSFVRSCRGYSEFCGDLEHVTYLIMGFILVEGQLHEHADVNIDLSFIAIKTEDHVEIEARLSPSTGAGSVAWGLTVWRLGEDSFHVSNA
jgi:hypothetical protein